MAFVTSSRPHARLVSVDPSKALVMEGVVDYFDHRDTVNNMFGVAITQDEMVFAEKEVFCVGQVRTDHAVFMMLYASQLML